MLAFLALPAIVAGVLPWALSYLAAPVIAQSNYVALPMSATEPSTSRPESAEDLAARERAGHQRMLKLLKEIAAQDEKDNAYIGQLGVAELRARFAQLPGGSPGLERFEVALRLARNELRLGEADLAIEHYREAAGELGRYRQFFAMKDVVPTIFELGVAYMRWGETQNCVVRHTSDSCIFPIRGRGVHVQKEGSEQAIEYFKRVMENSEPGSAFHTRARWLLNIAYMTLGRYPDGVPQALRIDPAAFASDETIPRFTEIAPKLGLNTFDLSGGAGVEDFNGDGSLDIVVSTLDSSGPMHYYQNNGDGTFSDRTKAAGLTGLLGGLNLNLTDYNNDGWVDIYVLRGGWFRDQGRHPNSLLRNNGDGTFTDVTFISGLGDVNYPTQTGGWADYDNDGDLDLYVGNETDQKLSAPGQLFRNNGDGTFTDVAEQAGVRNMRYAKGVSWGDYDDDGFVDLYVSNMGTENRLYRNNGDGTFTDVAQKLGVVLPNAGFPTWFWDFDNDGVLDLWVGSYYGATLKPDVADLAGGYMGLQRTAELDCLYRGDGKGGFTDVAAERGLTRVTIPMGSNFGDLDSDGYLDFLLGTGYPEYEALMPNIMYRNQKGERFVDVSSSGGFGHLQKGHAVVFVDLDEDGDTDVYQQMGGAFPGDAFGNALYQNPGFRNNWIKIRLVGVKSNRPAIGARIRVEVAVDDGTRSVFRHVNTGGSFGANPFRQEIGLGRAKQIERIEVRWPGNGTTQTFSNVAINQSIEITEGEAAARVDRAR